MLTCPSKICTTLVSTPFQKPRGIAMPQRVRREVSRDAGFASYCPERVPQRFAAGRSVATPAGAEPPWVAMRLPETPQLGKHGLRQRYPALFVALADDADQSIDAIDQPTPTPISCCENGVRPLNSNGMIAVTSRVAASLMRSPHAYMRSKAALGTGFLTRPRIVRASASDRTLGRRLRLRGQTLF
jgi:hypothetical protein